MGSIVRPLLFTAPLMLAAPLHAQQTEAPATGLAIPPANTAPAPDPSRQGPELNVFRDPVTPRTTQPVITPPPVTVQPVPQQAPSRPAASRPTTAPATTAPATPRQTTPEPKAQRPAERETPKPQAAPAPAAPTEDEAAANQSAPVETTPQSLPVPVPATNAVEPSTPVTTPAPTTEEGLSLPWIIGGILALIALAAAFLLRRRRPAEAPVPIAKAATPPAPKPSEAAPQPSPEPRPVAPAPAPAPAPVTADRPWLDMDMAVGQARYSMMGVTIAYSLILHNRGNRPAQDILIRAIVGNAGAQQSALLQSFFAGENGLPLHSALSIAPGETHQLTGELRLSPEEIVPVTMGQRSLLIPLAAFDMAYRWSMEGEEPGQGRTARAFIVGQEQEPPADRLAPLRLDQGPRQYPRPAARAAAELTPA
jgi:MYXO-CTERM domain-containing protein